MNWLEQAELIRNAEQSVTASYNSRISVRSFLKRDTVGIYRESGANRERAELYISFGIHLCSRRLQ